MQTLQSKLEFIKAPAQAQSQELAEVETVVRDVISAVRACGDDAVRPPCV